MRYLLIAAVLTLTACSIRALALLETEEAVRGSTSITKEQKNENDPTALQKGIGAGITGVLPFASPTPINGS